MSADTTTNNVIMAITEKFDRFRDQVYNLSHNKTDEYIVKLMNMSTSEFLGAAQVLIRANSITTAEEMRKAILAATNFEEDYSKLCASDQKCLSQYCAYFYEVS